MRCLSTASHTMRPCSACRGRVPDNHKCSACGGSGVVRFTHGKPVVVGKKSGQ